MTLISETHLPVGQRTLGLVRVFPLKKRKFWGWVGFAAFLILNETRGLVMVAQFLKAYAAS